MSEVLRDPLWQFIAVVVAIVVAAISIYLTLRSHMRKSFSFQIVSCTPLLSVKEEIREKVQVLYEGNPIKQAHLCVVKFTNSGNAPIEQKDYSKKLSLEFGEKAQVLASEIIEQNPPNLGVSIFVDGKRVSISPSMLNPTDSFTVRSLVSEYEDVGVDGRIVGVKEIRRIGEASIMSPWFGILWIIFFALYIGSFAILSLSGPNALNYTPLFLGMLISSVIVMIPLTIWTLIWFYRRLRIRRRYLKSKNIARN